MVILIFAICEKKRSDHAYRYLQAIGANQGSSMLLKSLLFYVVINLEAFIFCFAGEYLSIKVSITIIDFDNTNFFLLLPFVFQIFSLSDLTSRAR